jgi:hypothetical protein
MDEIEPDVRAVIDGIGSATRRRDALTLLELMGRVTGEPALLSSATVIGFGQYHYRYASGREGDAAAAGFSPQKAASVIYLLDGVGAYAAQLERLGAHRTGVGSVYITNLDKVDLAVLEAIIAESYRTLTAGTYEHRARESQGGRPSPRGQAS